MKSLGSEYTNLLKSAKGTPAFLAKLNLYNATGSTWETFEVSDVFIHPGRRSALGSTKILPVQIELGAAEVNRGSISLTITDPDFWQPLVNEYQLRGQGVEIYWIFRELSTTATLLKIFEGIIRDIKISPHTLEIIVRESQGRMAEDVEIPTEGKFILPFFTEDGPGLTAIELLRSANVDDSLIDTTQITNAAAGYFDNLKLWRSLFEPTAIDDLFSSFAEQMNFYVYYTGTEYKAAVIGDPPAGETIYPLRRHFLLADPSMSAEKDYNRLVFYFDYNPVNERYESFLHKIESNYDPLSTLAGPSYIELTDITYHQFTTCLTDDGTLYVLYLYGGTWYFYKKPRAGAWSQLTSPSSLYTDDYFPQIAYYPGDGGSYNECIVLKRGVTTRGGSLSAAATLDDVFKYDIATGTWSTYSGSTLSTEAHAACAMVVYDNYLYAAGGFRYNASTPGSFLQMSQDCYRLQLNATSPTWAQVGSTIEIPICPGASQPTSGGKWYVYGGTERWIWGSFTLDGPAATDRFFAFDFSTQTWTQNFGTGNHPPQLIAPTIFERTTSDTTPPPAGIHLAAGFSDWYTQNRGWFVYDETNNRWNEWGRGWLLDAREATLNQIHYDSGGGDAGRLYHFRPGLNGAGFFDENPLKIFDFSQIEKFRNERGEIRTKEIFNDWVRSKKVSESDWNKIPGVWIAHIGAKHVTGTIQLQFVRATGGETTLQLGTGAQVETADQDHILLQDDITGWPWTRREIVVWCQEEMFPSASTYTVNLTISNFDAAHYDSIDDLAETLRLAAANNEIWSFSIALAAAGEWEGLPEPGDYIKLLPPLPETVRWKGYSDTKKPVFQILSVKLKLESIEIEAIRVGEET